MDAVFVCFGVVCIFAFECSVAVLVLVFWSVVVLVVFCIPDMGGEGWWRGNRAKKQEMEPKRAREELLQ